MSVHIGWWNELRVPVGGELNNPVSPVHHPMMMTAEGDAVVTVGPTTLLPVPDMVDISPSGWPVTARECAAAVAQQDRLACRTGPEPPLPAKVEHLTRPVHDPWQDHRVAGHPPDRVRRDSPAVVERPCA